jgi:hypothetical protein
MNGIYLTQEGKQEIEAKIAELEDYTYATQDLHLEGCIKGHLYCLKEILSSAIVLPVEESWNDFYNNSDSLYNQEDYPNGVIIQPKQ